MRTGEDGEREWRRKRRASISVLTALEGEKVSWFFVLFQSA